MAQRFLLICWNPEGWWVVQGAAPDSCQDPRPRYQTSEFPTELPTHTQDIPSEGDTPAFIIPRITAIDRARKRRLVGAVRCGGQQAEWTGVGDPPRPPTPIRAQFLPGMVRSTLTELSACPNRTEFKVHTPFFPRTLKIIQGPHPPVFRGP
jgi:hypothetical protein